MLLKLPNIFFIIFFCFLLSFNTEVKGEPLRAAAISEIKGVYLQNTLLFETDRGFNRVTVGDAKIAGARALSPRQLLIKGYTPGRTNLIIWYIGDTSPKIYNFKVEIDPKMLADVEALIKKLVPFSRVRAIPVNKELLLEGEVESQRDLQRVLQIACAFFSYKKQKKGEKGEEGKSSQTFYVGSGSGGGESDDEGEGQLEQNLDMSLAIKSNLIVLKGCQQVQLEVKIAEVSRSTMKKMGLSFLNNRDWGVGVFPTGSTSGTLDNSPLRTTVTSTGGGVATVSSTGGNTLESGADIASPFGAAFQVLLHSFNDNSLAILSILKGQGLARILATPTIVTMSGQPARFNVGGEFPVPTTDSDGSTNIDYKEYGVLLEFTPTVIGKETISLKIAPQVSSPDWSLGTTSGGVSVPGVKTRTAQSTLELKDGQTFVMAGLLKEESHVVINKIPGLGDLPFIGILFTSKEVEKNETELVIIVTPRLVRPLNRNEVVALPGDDLHDKVSDLDFFLLNRTSKKKKVAYNKDKNDIPPFKGEIGFVR